MAPSYGQVWNCRRVTLKATVILTTKYNQSTKHIFCLIWIEKKILEFHYFLLICNLILQKKSIFSSRSFLCAAHKYILDKDIMSSFAGHEWRYWKVLNVWDSYQSSEHLRLTVMRVHIISTIEENLHLWCCLIQIFSQYCKSDEAALINSDRSSSRWLDVLYIFILFSAKVMPVLTSMVCPRILWTLHLSLR